MSMFNDILWWSEDNERECNANADLVSIFARKFPPGRWSFLVFGSEKKWYSTCIDRPQGEWDGVAELMMIKFGESGHPVFWATESIVPWIAQKQRRWKIINTVMCRRWFAWNCFSHNIFCWSAQCLRNSLRFVWWIQDLSNKNGESRAGRTIWPIVCANKFVYETPTPSTEVPVQEDQLQKYQERVERLSQQNRVIKKFIDAGFLTTVEVGQYFMTKDTEEFSQFTSPVACREYTLPRDEKSSDPKGWIRGNTKIGPVLEVTTSYLQGKYGVEILIESVHEDNSHSWVRISHGLNKLVTDLIDKEYDDNEQETSEMKAEEFALKANVLAFASRSKAKARPRRRTPACSSTRTVPVSERSWTDIEPENYSSIAYPVSKRLIIHLEKMMERLNSGD